jgi:multiple sugar transport system substrate-binding protein
VNFIELLSSAGGTVLADDGETVEVDSPETREVLEFMRGGIESGAVPKAVTTYEEELGKESQIADSFAITTFPPFKGGEGAGALGGYNLGVSAYSDNPEGSLAFAEFLLKPEIQKEMVIKATLPATVTSVYQDQEVKQKVPFAGDLLKALEQAVPRPISPVYPEISEAIYNNVYAVLQGRSNPDQAASAMKSQIEDALARF